MSDRRDQPAPARDGKRPQRTSERGARRRPEEVGEVWPEIPDWATTEVLGPEVLRDLRGLTKENAAFVAGHLVAAGSLAEEDPELAWRHARAARSRGGRIAVVRETVGLVAYRAGEWAEAISELRAARRLGGGPGHLPVMADCERALGHPERAIELSRSVEADRLSVDEAREFGIVVAGARADLGQLDAALAQLEHLGAGPVATGTVSPRLAYAYADLLEQAGREQAALSWFVRAADADADEDTDAADRIATLSARAATSGPAHPLDAGDRDDVPPAAPDADKPAGPDHRDPGAPDGKDSGTAASAGTVVITSDPAGTPPAGGDAVGSVRDDEPGSGGADDATALLESERPVASPLFSDTAAFVDRRVAADDDDDDDDDDDRHDDA